jgi:hypothetical protein
VENKGELAKKGTFAFLKLLLLHLQKMQQYQNDAYDKSFL